MGSSELGPVMVVFPLALLILALFTAGFWRWTRDAAFGLAALNCLTQLVGPPMLGISQQLSTPFTHIGMIGSIWNGITFSLLLQQTLGFKQSFAFEGVISVLGVGLSILLNGREDLPWLLRMLPLELPLLLSNLRTCYLAATRSTGRLGYAGLGYVSMSVGLSIFLLSYGFCLDYPEFMSTGWGIAMLMGLTEVFMLQGWLLERSVRAQTETEHDLKTVQAFQNTARLSQMGQLTASLLHEIAQPVQVIQSVSQAMRMDHETHGDKKISLLERLERQTERLSQLVGAMRSAVRDGITQETTVVPLEKTASEVRDFMRGRLRSDETEFYVTVQSPEPTLEWNSVFLTQVLLNLISNAADAVKNLPERWIRVEIRGLANGNVQFVCTDSGAGIPAAVAENLFRPLFTTKPQGQGTGLGLSFCQMLVQNRGGTIRLDSGSPHTCFVVEIPPKAAAPGQAA